MTGLPATQTFRPKGQAAPVLDGFHVSRSMVRYLKLPFKGLAGGDIKEPVAAFRSCLSQPKMPAFDRAFDRIGSFIGTHTCNGKRMALQRSQVSELLVQSGDWTGIS